MKFCTYSEPKELERVIDEYFDKTPEEKITLTGLILYLGICKDTFYEYGKREGYKNIINQARLRIENTYEHDLRNKGRSGDIFALKNFGWRDQQEITAEVKQTNITIDLED